jgi:CRP-like cAMP-binding protein
MQGVPMNLDPHRLRVDLQRLDWARQLSEEVIEDIAGSARVMEFQAGQVVIELDSEVNSVYFVLTGRLEGVLFDRLGKEILRDTFQRGSVVGLFSVLVADRSHLRVEAVEHTTVIHLGLDDLLRLMAKYREFQLTKLCIAANLVKHMMLVDRDLPRPAAVTVIHHSDASHPLTAALTRRLHQLGESPSVAGDDERWKPEAGIPYRLLFENGVSIGPRANQTVIKGMDGSQPFLHRCSSRSCSG